MIGIQLDGPGDKGGLRFTSEIAATIPSRQGTSPPATANAAASTRIPALTAIPAGVPGVVSCSAAAPAAAAATP